MQTQLPTTILTCAVLLAAGLAGCLGTDDGGGALETSGPTTSASASPTATVSPSPSPSDAPEPPVAGLDADVFAGAAPLLVNFTLTNAGGTAAAWTLVSTLDENETDIASDTDLPADVNHTFEAAGNHSVELVIEGVDGSTDTASVTISVEQTAAGGAVAYSFTGSFSEQVDGVQATPEFHEFSVPEGATQVIASLRWGDALNWPATSDLDLYLYNADGDEVDDSASFAVFESVRYTDVASDGPGTWQVEVYPFVALETSYTVDVIVLMGEPRSHDFEAGTVTGQVLGDPVSHELEIPDDATLVMAWLDWRTAPTTDALTSCSTASQYTTDLDLYAYLDGTEEFRSADFGTCEWGYVWSKDGESLGGAWDFQVDQFLSAESEYTVHVEWI